MSKMSRLSLYLILWVGMATVGVRAQDATAEMTPEPASEALPQLDLSQFEINVPPDDQSAALAQSSPDVAPLRDGGAIAARYGQETPDAVADLPPLYELGDVAEFNAPQRRPGEIARERTALRAVLAARAERVVLAGVGGAYLWVDEAVIEAGGFNPDDPQTQAQMTGMAQAITATFDALRTRSLYEPAPRVPGFAPLEGVTEYLPLPDRDNDPHYYIVFTRDLGETRDAVLLENSPHETIFVNTTLLTGVPLYDGVYIRAITRAYLDWMLMQVNPRLAPWLHETLTGELLNAVTNTTLTARAVLPYFLAPGTPLTRTSTFGAEAASTAARGLFLLYLGQRTGGDTLRDLFLTPPANDRPLSSVETVLQATDALDPMTGAAPTARELYADFLLANGINVPFGDNRYVHQAIQFPQGFRSLGETFVPGESASGEVSPYSAAYYVYNSPEGGDFTLTFAGDETTPRLPGENAPEQFWVSSRAPNADSTLTAALDLTGVDSSDETALTFSAWYSLAEAWDGAYVSVSSDGGARWETLPVLAGEELPDGSAGQNWRGLLLPNALTGVSNPDAPQPLPVLNVIIGNDGFTLSGIVPGGVAAAAGLQPGDRVVGYDGQLWGETPFLVPNIVGLLNTLAPGDVLTLEVERPLVNPEATAEATPEATDSPAPETTAEPQVERLQIPVTLGAHPNRTAAPAALWRNYRVDLAPYAGQSILLRFEVITGPGREREGMAVANIAVDLGDQPAPELIWDAAGWQQVGSTTPSRWRVGAFTSGTESTPARVQWLLTGDDEAGSAGEWPLSLGANEIMLVVVSPVTDETTVSAGYTVALNTAE